MDPSRPSLSVVLPVYNEERNVAAMAARLAEIAGPFGSYEILFVDDCSTDRSLSEIKSLAERDRRIRFVAFTRNFGHQAALRAGLRYARGDAVILMDCDFEHPPELIPAMIAEWRKGAKIVVTERTSAPRQLSFLKSLSSRLFYRLLDAIGDVRIEPGSADFLLLDRSRRRHHQRLRDARDISARPRALARLSARQAHVHAGHPAGRRIQVHASPHDRLRRSWASSRTASSRCASPSICRSLFAAIGVLLLVYSLASFLWIGHTVAGWTSVMSAIALLGAGQFLVLGIIGEYIGRLLGETRKWPVYLVAETEEANRPANAGPARGAARAAGA